VNHAALVRNLCTLPGVRAAAAFDPTGACLASSLPGGYAALRSEPVVLQLLSLSKAFDGVFDKVRFLTLRCAEAQLVLAAVGGAQLVLITDPFLTLRAIRAGFQTALEMQAGAAPPTRPSPPPARPDPQAPPAGRTNLGIWD